jgi:hypothetical protein
MGLYDIGQNFQPGVGPALNTRGAYSFAPMAGSSNLSSASTPMAGKYAGLTNIFSDPGYQKLSEADKSRYIQMVTPSADTQLINAFTNPDYLAGQEAMQERAIQRGLAAYKQMGDEQMKYNLINRGLTALQTGIERGLTKYQDPYSIANMLANGYAEGARASAGLAQIGSNIPVIKYYRD